MSWRDARTLYLFEIRAALRERTIVINSILIPILLYPFILWVTFTGLIFVQGQTERFVSRVVINDLPKDHDGLLSQLQEEEQVEVLPSRAATESLEQMKSGDVDALVEFLPPSNRGGALDGNFRVRLTTYSSREQSEIARRRLVDILDRYRDDWLKREAAEVGLSKAEWQVFALERRNVASRKEMGAFILGQILPLFFVIMVAVGCFYPAVDATAGERERNTWETTMTMAVARSSIVAAKYLYVATFGFVAGAVNLAAMAVTMGPILAPLLARDRDVMEFSLPMNGLPILVVGAVLLACFLAAGMMIFAAFARTFREGQSMITPFFLLALLPVLFLQVPGIEFTPMLAMIPVVNVTMMVREAISGTFHWLPIMITIGVELAAVTLCIWVAAFILRFEDLVVGSYNGSAGTFLRDRLLRLRTDTVAGGLR
ncbi:MAG: ABC transporter permease [Candidatus Methylomirabilales bacterium]